MVGYIEICEINGLGQGVSLCFLASKKEVCGYMYRISRVLQLFVTLRNVKFNANISLPS